MPRAPAISSLMKPLGLGVFALTLALAAGAPLQAQEPAPKERVALDMRIVSIKAGGELKGDKPFLGPKIKAYAPLLSPLGYDRYRGLDAEVHAGAGQQLRFERLPLSYHADVSWKPGQEGTLLLELRISRPPRAGEKEARVTVVRLKVKAPSGQHFLVKLTDAYPDGDMLLLVTARSALAG